MLVSHKHQTKKKNSPKLGNELILCAIKPPKQHLQVPGSKICQVQQTATTTTNSLHVNSRT